MAGDGRARDGAPSVLLVGYNGANNTGSEARLLSIIEDVRAVLGPGAQMTVPTLNERNLRRYLKEGPGLRIEPVPSIFFFALKRLVRQNDLMMLVEGSCYMDTWTTALLLAFTSATRYAKAAGKASLAYAVDVGDLSPGNRRRVRTEASKTDLIITRTGAAARRLEALGVTAPLEVTADTAFTYVPEEADEGFLWRSWPEARGPVAGLSVVDFHLWPVVVRLYGKAEHCYKWPYYFLRSPERCRATLELAGHWAALADRIVERHGMDIALLAMEELDTPLAGEVLRRMRHPARARIFSSRELNASRMSWVLRDLDLLLTSRYHAAVLSMARPVPMAALPHDPRLSGLFGELGMDDLLVDRNAPDAWTRLEAAVDRLVAGRDLMVERLRAGNAAHVARARRNRELLRDFCRHRGWAVDG
ncbi:MAG: polysaccharide pyruvyl transferase family protein [Euryarchaeota archaeon]|nr:polysaccharide pyruvyl transferase family protein [Euryarchaeota archaeon]